jgi:hypothetical protein
MLDSSPIVPRLLLVLSALLSSACYGRAGPGLFFLAADTVLLTAAVVSLTRPPPPPRVVYVPEPRPGYAWQPGFWTLQNGQWVWVEGGWVALRLGYAWVPAHWENLPDETWRLVPGHWVSEGPPPGPPPPARPAASPPAPPAGPPQ